MTVEEIYRLPIRTFWLLETNISRLRAEEDLRHIRLLVSQHQSESLNELTSSLAADMGATVIAAPKRDEGGFSRLKDMTTG